MNSLEIGRRSFLAGTTALGVSALTSCASATRPTVSAETLLGPGFGGFVEEGWGLVADTFRTSFAEGRDRGGAVCVYVDGRPVVDLWGGVADKETNRPWDRDTVALVASTTKGATAICAHLLVQRGQLDLDAPVTRYWPEFGQAGKQDIPVRYLLSHQVGLPYVDTPLTFEDAQAWDPVIRALEIQPTLWIPGTEHLYHGVTYGYLVGEVIRRVSGKTVGAFFQEEVASPLGLSAWIGVPEEIEPRVARIDQEPFPIDRMQDLVVDFATAMQIDPAVAGTLIQEVYGPGTAFMRGGAVGGFQTIDINSRAYRAMEFPGGNMHASAHSIARMYAATVSEVDGFRLLRPETVERARALQTGTSRMHGVRDELLPATRNLFNMSLGFHLASPPVQQLLGPQSFGHPGSGGSLGAADPERRVGFAYVPGFWKAAMVDRRPMDLTAAVRQCLG